MGSEERLAFNTFAGVFRVLLNELSVLQVNDITACLQSLKSHMRPKRNGHLFEIDIY
jgi:hypothetical protein